MVKLKFVIKDGTLVLRISEGAERFYRSAMSVLTGAPNLSRCFNKNKECFYYRSPNSDENNAALDSLKKLYLDLIFEHPEYTAKQVADHFSSKNASRKKISVDTKADIEYRTLIAKFLEKVIQREKAKQGCNFETYQKVLRKCRKIVPDFENLKFHDIDYDKCVELASIFAKYPGYIHTAKQFRNTLGKAHKDRNVDFQISQIGDFNFMDYDPEINTRQVKKPDVLTEDQIGRFLKMDPMKITPDYKDRNMVRLFYDFCVFMLQSFMAPCDVMKLRYSDITGNRTISTKRKKTHRPVEVPISPDMDTIMCRYSSFSKDGYIFPILDDEKDKEYKTKEYSLKKFREALNVWLKDLGKELGTRYRLYAYVFRHTAITMALDNGLPISYVANIAGTSIEMIQKHYYNGDSIQNSNKLQMMFVKASRIA